MNRIARRTEPAERDLQDIAYQIAAKNGRPQTADRVIDELSAQAKKLARTSGIAEMGTAAPELDEGVRLGVTAFDASWHASGST